MPDRRIRETTRAVLELLVAGDYGEVEHRTGGLRLSADALREAVDEYGRQLTMPPGDALDALDVVEVDNSDPKTWSVRCDLWTEEEGRSDLTLELTLIDAGEHLRVEVDNLHVL